MPTTESRKEKERTIKRVSKAVAAKVLEEAELEDLDEGIDEAAIHPQEQVDLFGPPTQELIDMGESPRYTIYKNNDLLVTKHYPWSWEKTQEEFGAGFYKIQLKRGNGTIYKTQQMSVLDPVSRGGDLRDSDFGFGKSHEPVVSDTDQFLKMATFMKTMTGDTEAKVREAAERAEQRARESAERADREAKQSARDQSGLLTTFLTMMQTTTQNSQNMFLEMMKSMNESNAKMFERMNSKIESATSKKDSLDSLTLMKLVQDAEDRGYEKFKEMEERAEKKADRLLEEREERTEPESLMGSLVKSFVPIISQAVKDNQAGGQSSDSRQLTAPPSPAQIAEAQRQDHLRRVAAHNEKARRENEARKTRASGLQGDSALAGEGRASGQPKVVRDALGLPKVAETGPKAGSVKQKLNGNFKEAVLSLVFPVIADGLINGVQPHTTAGKSLDLLAKNGISANDVLESFTLSSIIEIAHAQGVPPDADGWLGEYYAFIQGKGSLKDASIQASAGNEPRPQEVGSSSAGTTA